VKALEATARKRRIDRRAETVDEAVRLCDGEKPLESESRTWLRGETNPRGTQRTKPSRT
jgi:hypothetical protein